MRHRPLRLLAAAATVAVAALSFPASAQSVTTTAGGVVGTDPANDWGQAAGADPRVGDALGQELTSASIVPSADGRTLNFVIGINSLPANGGAPEVSRYTWNIDVDPTPHVLGEDGVNADLKGYDIDGKWLNYTRGACDPTAGTCPPPRDPGPQPFVLRGDCAVDDSTSVNLTVCKEKAKVSAVFSPEKKTITIPLPVDALGLPACGTIAGGAGTFGGSISAAPSAFVTSDRMPLDTLTVDGVYRAPSGTTEPCPEIPQPDAE